MFSEPKACPGLEVSIDAGKHAFISVTKLRALVKLLAREGGKLTVFNVKARPLGF